MLDRKGNDNRTSILDVVVKGALCAGDATTLMVEEELSVVMFTLPSLKTVCSVLSAAVCIAYSRHSNNIDII
jgi:hypothetical protein